jgi:hypothetical protein
MFPLGHQLSVFFLIVCFGLTDSLWQLQDDDELSKEPQPASILGVMEGFDSKCIFLLGLRSGCRIAPPTTCNCVDAFVKVRGPL